MGCVEDSGVPVLYIGRRVPKGLDMTDILQTNMTWETVEG
jgi:hypothetical protein